MRYRQLVITEVLLLLGCAVSAAKPGAMISSTQVAAALLARDIPVAFTQIVLPAPVPVRRLDAPIEITAIDEFDATHSKVKLRCREAADCLPFYAVVAWQRPQDFQDVLQRQNFLPRTQSARPHAQEPLLVHAGDAATLVLEGRNVRIQLAVICLNNGSAGRSVRVTTTDRKHIYRAQVAGPGLLKAGI